MEKITPKQVPWSAKLEARFVAAGFTPSIIDELRLGEVYQVDELIVITRTEAINANAFEVVWMASLGKGLAKWGEVFFQGAKRAGASYIRFHIDEHEKALVRLIRRWKPSQVFDKRFDGQVYRIDLHPHLVNTEGDHEQF